MTTSRPSNAAREVGARLRRARETLDLTQDQLARLLGVSFKTLSSWEVGDRLANPLALARLADRYSIPTDYFWRGTLLGVPADLRDKLSH